MQQTFISVQKTLHEILTDASIDRVWAIDTNWRIIAWNQTSADLTGISKSAAMNQLLPELFPQLTKDRETMNAIQQAFNGWKSFLPVQRNTFHRHHYENHFIPLKNEEGVVLGVMNIMHDVSHRIKAEQQLQRLHEELEIKYHQLERMSADLSMFTCITSTNLKEPVKLIYTGLEQLARTDGHLLSNNSKAKLRKMQSSLNRINLLLEDILSLSSINSVIIKAEEVNLQEIFQSMFEDERLGPKIKEKNATILSAELPVIYGNKEMIGYLFFHLLDNAIKFQEEGNHPVVKISADLVEGQPLHKSASDKNYHCLSFTDNGIGFEEKDNQIIFRMFSKLNPDRFRGSGIGLAICQKIMDAHNGFIRAESIPGAGSSFSCYFPA